MSSDTSLKPIEEVLDRLLDPDHGCPWDLEQTPGTIKANLLEETYELLDAIEEGRLPDIKDEMGDCLFILVFLSKLYEKQDSQFLNQAVEAAAQKLIRRHPHVFEQGPNLEKADQVLDQWHKIKQAENNSDTYLSNVPKGLPALMQAHRLGERVGKVGFDWESPGKVLESMEIELAELKKAINDGDNEAITHELGDVLFTMANLSRRLKIKSEDSLQAANKRFRNRFLYIEEKLGKSGKSLETASLEEMDEIWEQAKSKGL